MLDIEKLNDLLQPIVGEPLSDMWIALGQVFDFGVQRPSTNRRGQEITVSDLVLKFISADWRVSQGGRILFGSSDGASHSAFWLEESTDQPHNIKARRLAKKFLRGVDDCKFIAELVNVGPFADVTIRCSHNVLIQCFSSAGEDKDSWWFFNRRTDMSFLVGPSGAHGGNSKRRPAGT